LAVTLMEQLIRRQRIKVAQWEEYPRIGMFLDELPNTPLPKILQYFAEARGLGVSICAAAQASSQLDVAYGALQGRAIRDVVPATLIMYGAHDEELMRSAAFWAGKTTRSHQSYDHHRDDNPDSRHHRSRRHATGGSRRQSEGRQWHRRCGESGRFRRRRTGINRQHIGACAFDPPGGTAAGKCIGRRHPSGGHDPAAASRWRDVSCSREHLDRHGGDR